MKKIILITGGQRSGKSAKAERLALSLSSSPVYVATAHVWDEEFRERVRKHQERRGPEWTTIEEERHLGRLDMTGRTVVIDCVTLWLTNIMMAATAHDEDRRGGAANEENAIDVTALMEQAKAEFDNFTRHDATYIFVTNEIGLGGVSPNALQRRFADLQGSMNQYIAQQADEVIMMVAGIEMKIKMKNEEFIHTLYFPPTASGISKTNENQ